jgi:hypothetical protein
LIIPNILSVGTYRTDRRLRVPIYGGYCDVEDFSDVPRTPSTYLRSAITLQPAEITAPVRICKPNDICVSCMYGNEQSVITRHGNYHLLFVTFAVPPINTRRRNFNE